MEKVIKKLRGGDSYSNIGIVLIAIISFVIAMSMTINVDSFALVPYLPKYAPPPNGDRYKHLHFVNFGARLIKHNSCLQHNAVKKNNVGNQPPPKRKIDRYKQQPLERTYRGDANLGSPDCLTLNINQIKRKSGKHGGIFGINVRKGSKGEILDKNIDSKALELMDPIEERMICSPNTTWTESIYQP